MGRDAKRAVDFDEFKALGKLLHSGDQLLGQCLSLNNRSLIPLCYTILYKISNTQEWGRMLNAPST